MNVECNVCKKDFALKELSIEESTLTKKGKIERCVVQYFTCPHCGEKYVVVVYDDRINKLRQKYEETSKRAKAEALKKQIMAEESMLLHLYMKQHNIKIKKV